MAAVAVRRGIVRGVDTCPECGNGDMRVRVVGGASIHECGLCRARFGERSAIEALDDVDEAEQRGVAPAVWPLVRALERLPGLLVEKVDGGDADAGGLPFVEVGVASADGLVQLENLTKSLQIGARDLLLRWVIEAEYRRHLAFVLRPRHADGPVAGDRVRAAQSDLAALRRLVERDSRLGWWRHAGGPRER